MDLHLDFHPVCLPILPEDDNRPCPTLDLDPELGEVEGGQDMEGPSMNSNLDVVGAEVDKSRQSVAVGMLVDFVGL